MDRFDEAILTGLEKWHSPPLNRFVLDVSSFGSSTVIAVISMFAFIVLWNIRNRPGAIRLAIAAGGAEIWLEIIKRVVRRPRPTIVPHLADVSGFSFPSGHALIATATYATIAAIVCTMLRARGGRLAICLLCAAVIALVGISRVYLGVHYPSDVAAGMLLGFLWFHCSRYVCRGLKA